MRRSMAGSLTAALTLFLCCSIATAGSSPSAKTASSLTAQTMSSPTAKAGSSLKAPSWLLLSGHNHSHASNEYSHDPDHSPGFPAFSSDGIAALGSLARQHRIDALVLTDHNSIRGCHDPRFGSHDRTWLCGEELTAGSAHATVVFPDVPALLAGGGEPFHPYHMLKRFCTRNQCLQHKAGVSWNLPPEGMQAVIDELQQRSSLVFLNHPRAGLPPLLAASLMPGRPQSRTVASWSWPYRSTLGAEGVEIGVPLVSRQRGAVAFWEEQLARGVRLTGVAGTDYHNGGGLANRSTGVDRWVMALPVGSDVASLSTPDRRRLLIDALGRGQAQVLANAAIETRVDLGVVLQGRRYAIGDTIDLGAAGSGEARVRVEVHAPRGGRLRLIRDGRTWGEPILLPTAPNVTITRALPLHGRGYIRAEVYGMKGSSTASDVLTNPVYWTRQVASVAAEVREGRIEARYAVPTGLGVRIFLTAAGTVPYGPSDPAIVARAAATTSTGQQVVLRPPGAGDWTVSVFPANADGELMNFRLPAVAAVHVPVEGVISSRTEPELAAPPDGSAPVAGP